MDCIEKEIEVLRNQIARAYKVTPKEIIPYKKMSTFTLNVIGPHNTVKQWRIDDEWKDFSGFVWNIATKFYVGRVNWNIYIQSMGGNAAIDIQSYQATNINMGAGTVALSNKIIQGFTAPGGTGGGIAINPAQTYHLEPGNMNDWLYMCPVLQITPSLAVPGDTLNYTVHTLFEGFQIMLS